MSERRGAYAAGGPRELIVEGAIVTTAADGPVASVYRMHSGAERAGAVVGSRPIPVAQTAHVDGADVADASLPVSS